MPTIPEPVLNVPDTHLGLYVHVPFCVRKCRYCDFPSIPLRGAQHVTPYLEALESEARRRRAEIDRPLSSVYIGGGTPTVLLPEQLFRLWQEVIAPFPRLPDAEVTLEANPGTLTDAMLAAIAALPITRVSLGVQSFDQSELAMLGRIHTPEEAEAGARALRAAGIARLNLDLMYGLPGQTVAGWERTLRRALSLQPDHLSCYALILEEDTPLTAQVQAGILSLPGEEEEIAMVASTEVLLTEAGFAGYEVSNAARAGAHCRHNLGYWLGRDYLGLGAAASSTIGNMRRRNVADIATYQTRCANEQPVTAYAERLSAPACLLERVMLGLRLRAGFNLRAVEMTCGCSLAVLTGDMLPRLISDGLLAQQADILRLTPAGFPLANQVMTRLMTARTE